MGENSAIEWTDHTFNPWIGCQRVSPGCDHCYAERLATARLRVAWGPGAERRRTVPSTWRQPLAWNRKAEREGKRARVFCASLADVFDNAVPAEWRLDLWELIFETLHLDWLLLTKRPQNMRDMLPWKGWEKPWPNVWLGTTAENQAEANRRIPHLLEVPAYLHFLSCEPLIGPLDLTRIEHHARGAPACFFNPLAGRGVSMGSTWTYPRLGWVIAGGESGHDARPAGRDWLRVVRDQCAWAGVPFFFKKWGEWAPVATPSEGTHFEGGTMIRRVGKRLAGALLDGREHRAVPHA
jgi:protein gp37